MAYTGTHSISLSFLSLSLQGAQLSFVSDSDLTFYDINVNVNRVSI